MTSIAQCDSLRTAHDSSEILTSLRLALLPVATGVLLALAFPPGNYRLLVPFPVRQFRAVAKRRDGFVGRVSRVV